MIENTIKFEQLQAIGDSIGKMSKFKRFIRKLFGLSNSFKINMQSIVEGTNVPVLNIQFDIEGDKHDLIFKIKR